MHFLRYLPFFIAVSILTFLVQDNAFFWDTIQLGSKHAHWFYEQNFQFLLLPAEIDSGHPPSFGMYLAAMWTVFGQTLAVSHFAMLPFLLGIVVLLFLLGDYYLGRTRAFWLPLLILLDPVFAGQSVLVSPDIVLIFFFLLGWLAVIQQKNKWLMLAAFGLAMVSMRGMMVVVVLYVAGLINSLFINDNSATEHPKTVQNYLLFCIKKAIPYIPSGLFAIAFFAFHYYKTGWIAYHPDSPWAGSFEAVDFQGFIKNLAVLAWRMLEFGRFFIWGVMAFIFIKLYQHQRFQEWWRAKEQIKFRQLSILLLVSLLVLLPSMLRYTGLMQNRYLLPIFIILDIMVLYLTVHQATIIFKEKNKLFINALCIAVVIALGTGNLWIYPRKISQGWDSTLAHLPYYDLRKKMNQYIDDHHIPYTVIGTRFPNIGSFQEKDLAGSKFGFEKADFSKHEYIFYSNIMNDFSDEELLELEKSGTIVQEFCTNGIEVILYKNPKK